MLYNGELTPPPFPGAVFVELMQTATSSVEFGFNNIMHREIDGVAKDSLLDPSLGNIFVGYYDFCFCFVLFAIFILHSRESELYRYTLDGKSALALVLPFSRFMGHLSST